MDYDPARDYQTGEVRASAGEQQTSEEKRELPAAISAADAKTLVQRMLAIEWAKRDKLTLRLPPRYLDLQPGARLQLPLSPSVWCVEKCTIESFAVVTELRPASGYIATPTPPMLADAGRITANPDVEAGPLRLALLDVSDVSQQSLSEPRLLLAASTATPGWKRRLVQVTVAGRTIIAQTAARKSVLGRAVATLPPGEPYILDTANSVDVELIDSDQWLLSCDDDALSGGANLAALGNELIQFGEVRPLGAGRFRLSRLLRGRGGTEWAGSSHAIDDVFCVIDPASTRSIPLPPSSLGALVTAAAQNGAAVSMIMSGESVRPLGPVNLIAKVDPTGDLVLNWTRRSRYGGAWLDEIEAPLGERVEQYRVTLTGSAGTAELSSGQTSLPVPMAAVAGLGSGSATIEVRQVGDLAASRPAEIAINVP